MFVSNKVAKFFFC